MPTAQTPDSQQVMIANAEKVRAVGPAISSSVYQTMEPEVPVYTSLNFGLFVRMVVKLCTFLDHSTLVLDMWVAQPTSLVDGSMTPVGKPLQIKDYVQGQPKKMSDALRNATTPGPNLLPQTPAPNNLAQRFQGVERTALNTPLPSVDETKADNSKGLAASVKPDESAINGDQQSIAQLMAMMQRMTAKMENMQEQHALANMERTVSGLAEAPRSLGLGKSGDTLVLNTYVNQALCLDCVFISKKTGLSESSVQRRITCTYSA